MAQCLQTGAPPSKDNMMDDQTGEPLMQRPDDTGEALVKRLNGYHTDTTPVLEHYRPEGMVVCANSNQAMDLVWGEISKALL